VVRYTVSCFGMILHSFYSNTHVSDVLNYAEVMDENSGVDNSGNEITGGANKADTAEETTAEKQSSCNGRDKNAQDATDTIIPRLPDDNDSRVGSNGMFLVVLCFGIILNPFRSRTFLLIA
jgi:hypothetical protein